MRTTVTFDDDVARLIADAQHRERRSFKQVVNDAVRRGLAQGEAIVQREAGRAEQGADEVAARDGLLWRERARGGAHPAM